MDTGKISSQDNVFKHVSDISAHYSGGLAVLVIIGKESDYDATVYRGTIDDAKVVRHSQTGWDWIHYYYYYMDS